MKKLNLVILFLTINLLGDGFPTDEIILEKETLFMPTGIHQFSPYNDKLENVTFSNGSEGQPVVGCAPLALGRIIFYNFKIDPTYSLNRFRHFLKNIQKVGKKLKLLSFPNERYTGIKGTPEIQLLANNLGFVAINPKKVDMSLSERERISDIYRYVRKRIKENEPVFVTSYKGGHAFIIDGYGATNPLFGKEDLYFHILYGWESTDEKWVQIDKGSGLEIFEFPTHLQEGYFGSWEINELDFFTLRQKSIYRWNGNGSLISFSSGNKTGFGLNYDISRIHSGVNNTVYFQWEIDKRDGKKIKISTPAKSDSFATITYGTWGTRAEDVVYQNVALPFVLDPSKDDKSTKDGDWYVIKVAFDEKISSTIKVQAEATKENASDEKSLQYNNKSKISPNHSWNGNASIISYSTDSLKGYGMNYDVTKIHTESKYNPTVFFQWEIDEQDGKKLQISAGDNTYKVNITYGSWGTRNNDKVYNNVTLPFIIDPSKDGKSTNNGDWYVIKVDFENKPLYENRIEAKAIK